MQKNAKDLITTITEAVQEKKGNGIVIADLSNIENVICKYFIICQGNSTIQVNAIAEEVKDYTREHADEKPLAVSGQENGIWVALDYSDIIVHIFQPEARAFYDLEHLWEDAKLTRIPDIK
jgi:ribosome-associated protein